MNKASLRIVLGLMACLLLGYGVTFGQTAGTEPQTQNLPEQTQAVQAETPSEPARMAREPRELPAPLTAEMTVAEHWSKNPYPRTMPVGARVHVVEKGDTLWDIAQAYYNNPLLWPQIWDANKYIPNAHWIYPGDPLVIPPMSPVSEEKIAEETAPAGPPTTTEQPTAPEGTMIAPPTRRSYPLAVDTDLYCSGFIAHDESKWTAKIIGNELNIEKVALDVFDIVYINRGEADGVSPGDEFTILKKVRSLEHPVTLEHLGDYILQTGRLKIVATQQHTSTGQITYSCDATQINSYLIPYEPKEVPVLADLPPVDRFSLEGPNPKGYIVFAKDDLGTVGVGHEVQIDLGAKDGINVGSRLILYRIQTKGYERTGFERDIPRRVLGEMVVFNVQDRTATGRIIQMYDFAEVGDRVEVR